MRLGLDGSIKLEFHGAKASSDRGFARCRELDEILYFTATGSGHWPTSARARVPLWPQRYRTAFRLRVLRRRCRRGYRPARLWRLPGPRSGPDNLTTSAPGPPSEPPDRLSEPGPLDEEANSTGLQHRQRAVRAILSPPLGCIRSNSYSSIIEGERLRL